MQIGWFKEVRVKDIQSHLVKALLVSRALLVKIKRDLENQVRGLLKNLGFVIGRAKYNVFTGRAEELIEDRPELIAIVAPLLKARKAIEQQIDDLDRKVLKLARNDPEVRRFMTVPGIGPNHGPLLQGNNRQSGALQAIEECGRLCRLDGSASCFR